MKHFTVFGMCFVAAGVLAAQSKVPPPKLDLVFDLHLQLAKPTDIGQIGPAGTRRVAVSLGGASKVLGCQGERHCKAKSCRRRLQDHPPGWIHRVGRPLHSPNGERRHDLRH
jgi:hypothetical protein